MEKILIFIVIFFLIIGCNQNKETVSEKNGKVTLTYWPAANPQETKLAQVLIKRWHKKNPDIRIKMQPLPAGKTSEEVLLAAIVARTTPDICSNILPSTIQRLTNANSVVCIDKFKDSREYILKRVRKKTLEGFLCPDGKLYQVPWKCNPLMYAYDVNLFKKLNIKPPKTYSEFWKIAPMLARDTNKDGRYDKWPIGPSIHVVWKQRMFDFYTYYAAASQGKSLLKNGKVNFNNKAARDVMKFFQYGYEKKFFPKIRENANLLIEKRIAMQLIGPWKIAEYEKHKPKGFKYDFCPVPKPDYVKGPAYTYGDPKNMVIFSTCKHPKAAWKFIKFLISEEADRLLLKICSQLPIRKDLVGNPKFSDIFQKQKLLQRFAAQVPYIAPLDNSPHLIEILDTISQQYEACAIYGIISPKEAIEKAAIRAATILKYW